MATHAFEDFKFNDYFMHCLYKAQSISKYILQAPLSQFDKVEKKTELGESLVWFVFKSRGQ